MGKSQQARYRGLKTFTIILTLIVSVSSCALAGKDEQRRRPKAITVWMTSDIVHDPLKARTSDQYFLTSLENRSLFSLTKDGELAKDLASKYSVSNNGLVTTITLGTQTFSDGTTITAQDVKATFQRIARSGKDFESIVDNIKGSGEAKNGADFFGITTTDSKTISFALVSPDPFFVYHLAHPWTSILPADSIDSQGTLTFGSHSGQYSAATIVNGIQGKTVYKPRDKKLPVVNVLRKSLDDFDKKPAKTSFDIALGTVKKTAGYKEQSVTQLASGSWNIYVANAASPLSSLKFRQAILLALDKQESIDAYASRAVAPTKFAGKTFDAINCGQACTTDTTKARALVKSVYPDGKVPTIMIDIEATNIPRDLAKSAKAKLLAIGIPATIREHSSSDLSNVIARGEAQLFRFGWVSDVANSSDALVKSFKADSTENVSGIADATLEQKITDYLTATSFSDRTTSSQALQERIQELWLMRPIAQFRSIITVNTGIMPFTTDYYGRANMGNIYLS